MHVKMIVIVRPTILFSLLQVVTLVGVKPSKQRSLDKMTINLDACCLVCLGIECSVLLDSLCQRGACSESSEVKYRGTESQPRSTRLGLKTASQPSAKHKWQMPSDSNHLPSDPMTASHSERERERCVKIKLVSQETSNCKSKQ